MIEQKRCTKCNDIKPVTSFVKDARLKSRLTSNCKDCRNPQSKKWRDENPEQVRLNNDRNKVLRKTYYSDAERKLKYRNSELMRKFGLIHEDYERMLAAQGGVCMICKRHRVASDKNFMTIDHCHKTGKIRGVLCNWCNRALGAFEDNQTFLTNAKLYLKGELK